MDVEAAQIIADAIGELVKAVSRVGVGIVTLGYCFSFSKTWVNNTILHALLKEMDYFPQTRRTKRKGTEG